MVRYLADLNAVDPVLREAAAIEALRTYDIVAALNEPRGTEVMGTLVTNSLGGEGEGEGRVGVGSAYGVVLLALCLVFIIWYVINNFREDVNTNGCRCPTCCLE
jgi:ABC-type sugar transport system permease subunit